MDDRAYRSSSKESFIFVKFKHGDPDNPSYVYYTDMESNKHVLGNDYISLPNMEVTYPQLTGGLSDPPCKIDLPLTAFSIALSGSYPNSMVDVTIYEWIKDSKDTAFQVRFEGRAFKAVKNYSNNRNIVRIECKQHKDTVDIPVGVTADLQCIWALGRGGCGVDIESLKETATVTNINKNVITVSGLTFTSTLNYYRKGFVLLNGVELKIRDHTNTTSLILVKNPPPSWLYATNLVVYPGCSKVISECRTKWNQEENFCGCGYAIPDYQPLIESP